MPVCPQCATENPEIAKFCLACGSPLAAAPPPQEVRKVVTIVFSDLKGSTSMGERLDSESLREVMTRYFDAMQAELERHGGVVEKFIGDAVMAVFGLPVLHEDDALRAVRAAAGMQRALEELNDDLDRHWGVRLANRTGVNTGEVVAGDPTAGQRLVTGDAVNVAARLEQAAGEQEVLLGDLTYRLVRDYVDVEQVEPLELKGKAEPVPAYRLAGVREAGERPRQVGTPMVGRQDEMRVLRDGLSAAKWENRARLVTVIGEAGVGKSRLVSEFLESVRDEAAVLQGRCLAYGDGITFWPLAEVVRQAAAIAERDDLETARQKLCALADDGDVVARVESAIGLSATPFPVQDLYWGARRLLEALARERPLVVVFDDIHWAEETFLELIEHVLQTAEEPVLLVCPARRDLLERHPDWSIGSQARRIELARLSDGETAAVAEHLLGEAGLDEHVKTRVVEAAEGNPLFVEQLLSMLMDEGLLRIEDGRWRVSGDVQRIAVPPSIHALLAARLDRLDSDQRAVIEPAAVIGHLFVREAVEHLTTDDVRPAVGTRLNELTDKQLVRPDPSRPAEEEPFRFQHILIRDTTYEGILKRARAELHERFVEWADSVNREGATEYEEILGYHLEQAHRYLAELAPLDDHGRALGAEGSRRLAAAGRRAFVRGDLSASSNLLGRACALLVEDDPVRVELLPEYGEALLQVGQFERAEDVLQEAARRAQGLGLARTGAHASLVRLLVRLRTGDAESWQDDAAVTIAEAMAVFQETGDHQGLAKCWRLLAWTHGTALHFGNAAAAHERAIEEARLVGDAKQEAQAATGYTVMAVLGPTPVPEAIRRCETMVGQVAGDRHSEAAILGYLGTLHAMQGSFEVARGHTARAVAVFEELRLDLPLAAMCIEAWRVEMLAGDIVAGERVLRRAYDRLEAVGERFLLSTVSGLLAQTLYELGRFGDAEPLAQLSRELATDADIDAQTLWRCIVGKLLARQGSAREGEALVREAIEMLSSTDAVWFHCYALLDLAEVHRRAGTEDLDAILLEARGLADGKGCSAMVAAIDGMLASASRPLV